MTLTAVEIKTVREGLDHDQRVCHNAAITEYLDQLATEIAKVRRLADDVPTDYPSEFAALALVQALGRINRPRGKTATIVNLLDLVQREAVQQARAHKVTWEKIAEQTGEVKQNIVRRFP